MQYCVGQLSRQVYQMPCHLNWNLRDGARDSLDIYHSATVLDFTGVFVFGDSCFSVEESQYIAASNCPQNYCKMGIWHWVLSCTYIFARAWDCIVGFGYYLYY